MKLRRLFFCAIPAAVLGLGLVLGVSSARAMGGKPEGGKNATAGTAGGSANGAGRMAVPPTPVRAQAVVRGDFPVYFYGLGTVTATNTVTVRSRVDGQLMRLAFREGQDVKAGDLLVEIDPRPYQAQLAQYEGQLLRDQALLRTAKQDLARYKVLLPQDSASPQQVDAQESLVRQYEGAVKVDQAQIEAVRLNLTYCHITAPISGRLGLKQVDEGNMVRASDSTGLVVITQVRPITVLFTVTEAQLPRVLTAVKAGKVPAVEAWDRTRTRLLATGELVTIDNLIDTGTGTIKLKAQFANEDDSLFPNQFVNARILADTVKDAVLAPTPAVQRGNQGSYVYAVKDGAARLRPVRTSEAGDEYTVVLEGLQPGEMLVIDGLDRLRDGAPVVVTPAGRLPGASGPWATPAGTGNSTLLPAGKGASGAAGAGTSSPGAGNATSRPAGASTPGAAPR